MPSNEEFKGKKPAFTVLLNGHFGDGKTQAGMTFPKVFAACFDPSGLDILYKKGNEKLLENLAWYEYLNNETTDGLRQVFDEKSKDLTSIYGCIEKAKQLAQEGKAQTFLIDGFTYCVDKKWQYICEFEEAKSQTTGNVDTQAMYRNLGIWANTFVSTNILPLATRYGMNVVFTCHLKRESREAIEGSDKAKNRAKKISGDSDIAPMIEGGFRNKIEGLFGASIYLETKVGNDGKAIKTAYCDTAFGYGTVLRAKNRYGLPAKLDITGKSFYDELIKSINQTVQVAQNKQGVNV